MTAQQIQYFEDFLNRKGEYKNFFTALKNAPIETHINTRDTYLPRVTPVLALSFGFFQDRNVSGIKEGEWRFLRNSFIHDAAADHMLGELFMGIDGDSIVSAINAVFNSKQFVSGQLKDVERFTLKIYNEAMRIMQEKGSDGRINHLTEFLRKCSLMVPPDVKFSDAERKHHTNSFVTTVLQGTEGKELRKKFNSQLNLLQQMSSTLNYSSAIDKLNSLVDAYDPIDKLIARARQQAEKVFDDNKASYQTEYAECVKKKADAEAELERIKQAQALPPKPEPQTEEVIVIMPKHADTKVKLQDNQLRCLFDPQGPAYRIIINSAISAVIEANGLLYYDLVRVGEKLHIRFSKSGDNKLYKYRSHYRINNKLFVEYLRDKYSVTSRSSRVNLSDVQQNPTAEMIRYEILGMESISFE